MTDLRIGHGLGPGAFWAPAQLLPIMTHYQLKICESGQKYNFTIYFKTSENANVKTHQYSNNTIILFVMQYKNTILLFFGDLQCLPPLR